MEETTMGCPYCQGNATQELQRATALGYRQYRCRPCRRTFNERAGTPFNHLQVPTDIALLVVLWQLRYKLSVTLGVRWVLGTLDEACVIEKCRLLGRD